MGRSDIHGGFRLLIIQNQELLAEAQAEEAGKLAAAVKRAEVAEARAEAAELELREKYRRSNPLTGGCRHVRKYPFWHEPARGG